MEFVRLIVGNITSIYSFVAPEYNYLISYESNVAKLKTEVQTLTALRTDMQRKVDDAKRKGEVIRESVDDWLRRVNDMIAEYSNSQTNEEVIAGSSSSQTNEEGHPGSNSQSSEGHPDVIRCMSWPFACLWQRRKRSKEAEEMAQKVSTIAEEGRLLQTDISFRAPSQMTTSSFARGYKVMESRTSVLNEIKEALKDPNIYKIGVHGMGGTGKTTLMNELAWQLEQEGSSFGKVVMVTVTNNLDFRRILRIQGELADKLCLKLESESEQGRAGELRGRLLKEESIVVILDDIWNELNLVELGVPFGDDHKGCKLVMTSRDLDLLKNNMDTQKNVALNVLSEPESLDLFEKTAGDVVKRPDIDPIARKVVKCCSGLPLLIVLVAKALKGKQNVPVWKNSLKTLVSKRGKQIDDVIKKLRFSYDCLESEEHRSLLLLIGSVGEYGIGLRNTHELFAMCWGLSIYENVSTLEEARNRHHTLIAGLRASSLLLEDGADEQLWMHDLVRDLVRSVACDEHSTVLLERLTRRNEGWKKDQLQNHHRIILPRYDIRELPEKLECPELKLLLLGCATDEILPVPDNFFSGITKVNVLHLSGMDYFKKSLPPSLCLLTELTSLNLSGCELEDIKIIGELKRLEILILEGVRELVKIPKEVGNLTHLRMLNVSNCPELRLIAKNLFSNTKYLEELYLLSFYSNLPLVSVEESYFASLGDIGNLHQLTTLELDVGNALNFPWNFGNFAKLKRYKICTGWRPRGFVASPKFSKNLALMDSSDSQRNMFNDHGVQLLLKTVESLYLTKLKLSSPMVNMEEICGGLPTFGMLKFIKVDCCRKMKNLFWSSHARHLSRLHEMEVSNCKSMTEIIAQEIQGREEEVIQLPKLHSLVLSHLPELRSFCSMSNDPRALFDKVAMPNLEIMVLSRIKTPEKLWDNVPAHPNIQNLTRLIDDGCEGLKSLLSPSVSRALVKLQYLEISNCQTLEEMFVQEQEQMQDQVTLPNLETLQISNMDNMKLLWHSQLTTNSFSKLNEMTIVGCPKLLNVFPSNVLNNLQNLKRLFVKDCSELKDIFEVQDQQLQNSLCKLKEVQISRCHKLSNVFPTNVLNNLLNLERLFVKNCSELKGIFEVQDQQVPNSLCKLNEMQIFRCPKLSNVFPSNVLNNLLNLGTLFVEECSELKGIFEVQDQQVPNSLCKLNEMQIATCPKLSNVFPSNVLNNLLNLERLFVEECSELKGIFEVQDQQVPNSLCKLYEMRIATCPKLSNVFPSNVLNNLLNLQRLFVENCSELEGIFEVKDQQVPNSLCMLYEMKIVRCPKLSNIFPSNVLNNLLNLGRLFVEECSELEGIFEIKDQQVPNFLCMLYEMKIVRCPKLFNVITPLMAASLSELRVLSIANCGSMKEIVANENDGDAQREIIFRKLNQLDLKNLARLTSFCSGQYSFNFPSLEKVHVFNCPEMKTFCTGNLTTPVLIKGVARTYQAYGYPELEKVYRWDGDLNTTIANTFEEDRAEEEEE